MVTLTARQVHDVRATLADENHPLSITSGVRSLRGEAGEGCMGRERMMTYLEGV